MPKNLTTTPEEPDDFDVTNERLDDILRNGSDLDAQGNPLPLDRRIRVYGTLDPAVHKENILLELNEMRMKRMKQQDMARHMGVAVRTIRRWLEILDDQIRKEARTIDPHLFIGTRLRESEYIKTRAQRIEANAADNSEAMKALALYLKAVELETRLSELMFSESKRILPRGKQKVPGAEETTALVEGVRRVLSAALRPDTSEAIDVEYTTTGDDDSEEAPFEEDEDYEDDPAEDA